MVANIAILSNTNISYLLNLTLLCIIILKLALVLFFDIIIYNQLAELN